MTRLRRREAYLVDGRTRITDQLDDDGYCLYSPHAWAHGEEPEAMLDDDEVPGQWLPMHVESQRGAGAIVVSLPHWGPHSHYEAAHLMHAPEARIVGAVLNPLRRRGLTWTEEEEETFRGDAINALRLLISDEAEFATDHLVVQFDPDLDQTEEVPLFQEGV